MARYERNPKLQARLAYLLGGTEGVALSVNFYLLFSAYFWKISIFLHLSAAPLAVYVTNLVVTLLFVFVVAYEVFKYIKGQAWTRKALIIENVVLVALGLLWFLHNRLGNSETRPDKWATLAGLLLPMVTLFPLIWPLLMFRPTPNFRAGR
jgi:predicted anti-sigma-YlaC factor YlaD